jgi:hypothetical protein
MEVGQGQNWGSSVKGKKIVDDVNVETYNIFSGIQNPETSFICIWL